uniref:YraN family protein n=1 Tax=uncultured Sphingomonas sp. TaxID=158754 RepID=UPI0025EA4338|nr:YraN family protein [uncultured Sphingomonas sp.]
MRRQRAEQRGRWAERLAGWWLQLHGWRILARRARVPGGEVDLVVRRGRTLAFVEVKARSDERAAAMALDRTRLKRVAMAAERLTPRYGAGCDVVRVDAVYVLPGRLPRHVPDVWSG